MAAAVVFDRPTTRRRRLDARVLLGFLLFVLAVGTGLAFWATFDESEAVLVTARDVAPGGALDSEDIAVIRMKVPPELSASVARAVERERLVGRIASEPLRAGELLATARLGGKPLVPPSGGVMAVAVKPETAVGGKVQIGDRVRVIGSLAGSSGEVRAETILPEAVVFDLGRAAQIGLTTTGTGERSPAPIATVSLVVRSPADMERLAAAKAKGTIDLVLLPPRGADASSSGSAAPIAADPPGSKAISPIPTPASGR